MLGLVLGYLLASAPAPAPAPTPAPIARGWISLAPFGLALPSPGGAASAAHRGAVEAGFRWGFDAGASFEPAPRLLVSLGAGFSQTIWLFDNDLQDGYSLCFRGDCYGWDERVVGQLMRVGPRLRVGYAGRRLLAWAHGSVVLGIGRVRLDCNNSVEDHCDRTETDLGPGVGGGVGLGVRVSSAVAIGVEGGVAQTWLDRRDDPFRGVRTVDFALVVALQF